MAPDGGKKQCKESPGEDTLSDMLGHCIGAGLLISSGNRLSNVFPNRFGV